MALGIGIGIGQYYWVLGALFGIILTLAQGVETFIQQSPFFPRGTFVDLV